MSTALWLLALLGVVGAFDTLWFHEWRGRLVADPAMRPELKLHVARDAIYVVIFAGLATLAWHGWWAAVLAVLLIVEIVITMVDFITEDKVRAGIGGVFPGERVTHAVMGIIYGAMLGYLAPTLWAWWQGPTALVGASHPVPAWLVWSLVLMAFGILAHGLRDLYAVLGLPGHQWPWPPVASAGTTTDLSDAPTSRATAPRPSERRATAPRSPEPRPSSPPSSKPRPSSPPSPAPRRSSPPSSEPVA